MRLAVIGTFHGRHSETIHLLKRVLVESTRPPDEFWIMCEDGKDFDAAHDALEVLEDAEMLFGYGKVNRLMLVPTPKKGDRYDVIPYSHKINKVLNMSEADAFVYLDNGSMPHERKYELMLAALEEDPGKGAVYCTQHRTGMQDVIHAADYRMQNGYGQVNYTQVMHRPVQARWPTSMQFANPDIADGMFWSFIHQELGDFFPVAGELVLDEHHIPSAAAAGL